MLRVSETFTSIQGESTFAGCLCFFIRLAGCNLSCVYCDTEYSKRFEDGKPVALSDLVAEAESSGAGIVEITGGEPLVQEDTPELCEALLNKGFKVLLETNGSLPVSAVPEDVVRILDCKTPSSGESGSMDFENYEIISPNDEIKFVIADEEDYKFALDIIRKYKLPEKTEKLLFSPVWGKMVPQVLSEWIIRDKAPVRFQLQLHKYIWDPELRGV